MNRKLRTTVPILREQLEPFIPDRNYLFTKGKEARDHQKQNFDRAHHAKTKDVLQPGDLVWIPDNKCSGTVTQQWENRSYEVFTSRGQNLRRNRWHLIPIYNTEEEEDDTDIYVDHEDIVEPQGDNQPNEKNSEVPQNSGSVNRWLPVVTRSGCISKPLIQINPSWTYKGRMMHC